MKPTARKELITGKYQWLEFGYKKLHPAENQAGSNPIL